MREAAKLFVNMRVTRLPVIQMMTARLTKLRVEQSENANLKERKFRLNQSSQTRLSLPHRVFLAKISPFVNPRHGIPVFQSIKTNPARVDISAEVNKEADVLAVDRSSTGGISVPSIQNPSSRNQKQTDMIKDEYFNVNDCNNLSLDFGKISNLTHDYYEYEQGQADIIVKSRLKKHYNFWKNIGCYDYILHYIQWVQNTVF